VAVVVVGGQTRGVGKTSVVCGLIAAMTEMEWTAIKVSAHGHSAEVEVREETSAGSEKDSARYLAAGAVRSFYISVPEGGLAMATPRLKGILAEARNAVVESTSVLAYLQPELALVVVDPEADEVKESLQQCAQRFDAVITLGSASLDGTLQELTAKPRFVVCPPEYGSEELHTFVRNVLGEKSSAP
jgi:molybdopterin-guanine dinucleotide biosynthesis protein